MSWSCCQNCMISKRLDIASTSAMNCVLTQYSHYYPKKNRVACATVDFLLTWTRQDSLHCSCIDER